MPAYAAPLFILRQEAQRDLYAVFEKLHECGFDGVELLGLFSKSPRALRVKLDELGLRCVGDHVDIAEFLAQPDRIIDERKEIGCAYITIGHGSGKFMPGTPQFERMLDDMRLLIGKCVAAGVTPQYHNHGWDVVGSPSYTERLMSSFMDAGLCLEPDIGWMTYSGADPATYLANYGKRCKVLHFKDVYAEDISKIRGLPPGSERFDAEHGRFEFRPTGYGVVNFPRLMPLCLTCEPEWIVIDHDLAYERDSYNDLRISLEYVKNLFEIHKA